jgi:hypothetical protein
MKVSKLASLLLGGLGLCVASAAQSQGATAASPFAAKHAAFQNSAVLFTNHNFVAGEAALEAGNLQRPGTVGWNVESGTALLKMAIYFRSQRDPVATNALLRLALNQFGMAENHYTSASKPSDIAVEKQIVGYIYENMLGNRVEALGFYKQAAALDPKNVEATNAMVRLSRSLAEEAKKH